MPRCGHERTKELAGIIFGLAKGYFEKVFFWKAQLLKHQVCRLKMLRNHERNLSWKHIFLSCYFKNDYCFLSHASNLQLQLQLMHENYQRTALSHQSWFNKPIHPNLHPMATTAFSMLRVKKLHYQNLSNHRTHKYPSRTTGHLEGIIGTANQEGRFLRSSELWDGTKFPKIEIKTCSAAITHLGSVSFLQDKISNTTVLHRPTPFLRNSIHNQKFNRTQSSHFPTDHINENYTTILKKT